jgi:hypothetical protein
VRANIAGFEKFFSPIGTGSVKKVIEKILTERKTSFFRLPNDLASHFMNDNRFKVELDRDNYDYLFKTIDLTCLKGRKYDSKRNLIARFKAEHAYEYIRLNDSNVRECLDFENKWCVIKDCDKIESLNNERLAIHEIVDNFSLSKLMAAAIKINNLIHAIAIAEKLNPNTAVMHVLKADPSIKGLYQIMNNEFILKELSTFEYVNFEQDLGVEGLRKAKLSYHPASLVEKFTLSKR